MQGQRHGLRDAGCLRGLGKAYVNVLLHDVASSEQIATGCHARPPAPGNPCGRDDNASALSATFKKSSPRVTGGGALKHESRRQMALISLRASPANPGAAPTRLPD